MKAKRYEKSDFRGEYRVEIELTSQTHLPGLPAPETADVRGDAPIPRRGRPATGAAMTAAERMRLMRARRKSQPSLFPSHHEAGSVELAQVDVVTNIRNASSELAQVAPVTKKKRVTKKVEPTERELLRQRLVDNVQCYQYHRYGNSYQQHCAFFERQAVVESLAKLGGMAGDW